jgi:hypothetical protein
MSGETKGKHDEENKVDVTVRPAADDAGHPALRSALKDADGVVVGIE